ncbi:hypothetical protein CPB85DRAFT_392719 [Mucidula mucida]|nr:hypothetical protein CPB85DRAFT_392719 [Mucidula mucida]
MATLRATTELGRVPLPCLSMSYGERPTRWYYFRDSLSDVSRKDDTLRLLRWFQGAGHMVVQEKPDLLAQLICESLDTINHTNTPLRSRL